MTEPWPDFLARARSSVEWQKVGLVLCLDPGETTGWALFGEGELLRCGQESTLGPAAMASFVSEQAEGYQPDFPGLERIVYEEYRIRGNKAKQHIGSEVVTIQHIGAIKVVADQYGIPLTKQGAGLAKGFATDTKLRRWSLYQSGLRHANDAIRHGVYFLLFGYGRKIAHGSGYQRTGGGESPDIT